MSGFAKQGRLDEPLKERGLEPPGPSGPGSHRTIAMGSRPEAEPLAFLFPAYGLDALCGVPATAALGRPMKRYT